MPDELPITDAERLVMEAVWEHAPASSRQIVEAVSAREDWQPKTVQTLISRLVAKGMLNHRREGRRYLYTPAVARDDFLRRKSRQFVDTFFRGRITPLVAAFAEAESISPEDLEALRNFVDSLDEPDGEGRA
ncbi:MAG: BlaI/MecI/CopY family transcriptional regulator [Gammaproteobacteria bacterium]|jgi:predicted transcriptional regulator